MTGSKSADGTTARSFTRQNSGAMEDTPMKHRSDRA